MAEREAAPALALVLTCCPVRVWDARGPGRSADSCQAVSDSRASALPGLRHRVPVIRFFLTSRNCRAGPLEYHMAFSTCRRLVSISLAGPTWLPLRTSPSCPSASSPAVSRLLPTLARPSSPRPTSFFLLRAQRRAPDYISRQAPRPVANRAPRIWRRRRRTGGGALCAEAAAAAAAATAAGAGGAEIRTEAEAGAGCRVPGRGVRLSIGTLGPRCPSGPPASGSSPAPAATRRPPSGRLPFAPRRPQPSVCPQTSPAGRAVALLSAGRHGRGARRRGNLVRGFHAA